MARLLVQSAGSLTGMVEECQGREQVFGFLPEAEVHWVKMRELG